MAIADDISVNVSGDVRRTGNAHGGGSPGYYTVIELHRYLQDLADDAVASGDDLLDITDDTPSSRSTDNIIQLDNGYNIDDDLSEYLYDGSIIQATGDDIYDGIVNFGNASFIQLLQSGDILANDYWNENGGLNPDSASGISHRFMVKVRSGGSDIDGRRMIGQAREFGNGYSEFSINGSTRGNNVLALSESTDINNATLQATVAAWSAQITKTEGYAGIDASGDAVDEFYYVEWDLGTQSKNDFYEFLKNLIRRGSTDTVFGLDQSTTPFRGITHEIVVDTPTGTFNAFEAVSWSGGTGQMLAINSPTAATKMWIQLLTGVAPTDGQTITGGASSATVDVNVTVTDRPLTANWVGSSTGTAIIGSYGLGITETDLSASDKVTDLDNTTITPPNNVTFTVSGLVSGEDRVLVGPRDTGVLDVDQLSNNGLLNGAAVGSVVVTEAIPSDTPSAGTIRVVNDSGYHIRLPYSSWTGSTFTLTGTYDFSGTEENDAVAATNDVYITYIDVLAGATSATFNVVYLSDRDLFVRVRDGDASPIKTFESPATLGASGGSISAIRTSDA